MGAVLNEMRIGGERLAYCPFIWKGRDFHEPSVRTDSISALPILIEKYSDKPSVNLLKLRKSQKRNDKEVIYWLRRWSHRAKLLHGVKKARSRKVVPLSSISHENFYDIICPTAKISSSSDHGTQFILSLLWHTRSGKRCLFAPRTPEFEHHWEKYGDYSKYEKKEDILSQPK